MRVGITERICHVCEILKDKDLTKEERQTIANDFIDILKMLEEGEKDARNNIA